MHKSGTLSMVTCALWAALAGGCLERKGATAGPEIGFGQVVGLGGGGVTAVDVLFIIDTSGSMRDEQANLAVQIPALVRDLAQPPDRDGNGQPDWSPVESLRIAVATTDVGTGTVQIPSSQCRPGGDNGELRDGIFEWAPGDDPDVFAGRVGATVQTLGTTGCAFEQQLEATARALERGREVGFPRADSLLAVIVVTDEDDCSVEDDDTFFHGVDPVTYNVHCTRNADRLTSIATLVQQIRGTRSEDEIVFAAITGVPRDLQANATPEDILRHPDMQYLEAEVVGRGLLPVPVCEFTTAAGVSLGEAAPARRLVQLAAALPGSVLTTICTDDFGPAIAEITERIGSRASGVCLVRELPDSDVVPCDVAVRLPAGAPCSTYPGYAWTETGSDGRELCEVAQVSSSSTEPGWFYDPSRDGCPQLAFTESGRPPVGADVLAECFFPVLRELGEQCARASQCASGWCHPVERTCSPLDPVAGDDPTPTGG